MKFHCQKVESTRNGKLRRLSGRFQTLIWRPAETVQNLVSPRLSGRVIDSPAILDTMLLIHSSWLRVAWYWPKIKILSVPHCCKCIIGSFITYFTILSHCWEILFAKMWKRPRLNSNVNEILYTILCRQLQAHTVIGYGTC